MISENILAQQKPKLQGLFLLVRTLGQLEDNRFFELLAVLFQLELEFFVRKTTTTKTSRDEFVSFFVV